ncbi:hypothetical protein CDL12_15741 [Handroanthus impetiginosus]|uniref:F-box domain-containing protein n=1 Tax=Handroanthus impetiginosus TaxID=429701 RepID=A0A2G9H2D6_9LAMI|nr:hypothetical protein CDL12_15741 [Handroanthus impetiginosus]
MSDEGFDFEPRLSESNKRYLCSDDDDDDYRSTARCRRKRLNYEDEEQEDSSECLAEELSGDIEEDDDKEVEEIGGGEKEIDGPSSGKEEIPIDRLSALPDSVLIRILSFLSMREAAITGVLSKRWQFLWTDSTSLKFYESSGQPEKIRKFVAWVHRTLVICSGNHLEQFEVDFMYDKCHASDINIWIEFALKNKVKDVALLFASCKDLYMLPPMMYSNSSLRSLSLRGCYIYPRRKNECSGFYCLELHSKTVRSLTVRDWEVRNDEPPLAILAPHIHSLGISLNITRKIFNIWSIKSVVRADIDFNGIDCVASSEKVMRYTEEIFQKFQHVGKLELGRGCIEVLSTLTLKGWQLPRSVRGHLIVNALTVTHSIPGIIGLLESSSNLETFVINGRRDPNEISINCVPSASHLQGDLNCDLLHLKTVHITGFVDPNLADSDLAGEPMLTLVQLLLKRAMALEKMVLDVEEFASSSTYIKIAKTLLTYPIEIFSESTNPTLLILSRAIWLQ